MNSLKLIKEASLDTETIKRLIDIHEGVWARISDEYPVVDQDDARQQLARMLLGLQTGGTDMADLEDKAITLMRASRQA